jgi:hypothetical protein
MITGDIITAIQAEAQALTSDTGAFVGQVILKTDFKDTGEITYTMPLLMLDIMDGPESTPFCGGAHKIDWNFGLDIYNYEPNAYGDDTSGYSGSLLDVIDLVRQHFSLRSWLTAGMTALESNYGFRLTLAGIHKASALKYKDGIIMGYRIHFESMAIDDGTDAVVISTATLEAVLPVPEE